MNTTKKFASLLIGFFLCSVLSMSAFAAHHEKMEEKATEASEMAKDKMHEMSDETNMNEEEMKAKMEKAQKAAKSEMEDATEEVDPD